MDTSGNEKKKSWSLADDWVFYAVTLIVLLFAAFGLLLWKSGLFTYDGTEPSAKVIGASLALAAGLIGSLISIVGIILKHSLDLRTAALTEQTERRLAVDSQRNSDLQTEAEMRLKLEAGIEAVKLLGANSAAGALFILSWLKIHDLATVLAGHMLAMDQLDPNSAAWLFHRSLKSGERQLEGEVSALLGAYVEKFLMPGGKGTFPQCLLEWDLSLDPDTRYNGAITMCYLVVSRPRSEWNQFQLMSIVGTLGIGWKNETNEFVKNEVGVCLKSMLEVLHLSESLEILDKTGSIQLATVISETKDLESHSDKTIELVGKIDKWDSARTRKTG